MQARDQRELQSKQSFATDSDCCGSWLLFVECLFSHLPDGGVTAVSLKIRGYHMCALGPLAGADFLYSLSDDIFGMG